MLFKSDTMNALVACDLLDEGFTINESLEALDSFSFLLEEGRSGELYSLILTEGNQLDEDLGESPGSTGRDKELKNRDTALAASNLEARKKKLADRKKGAEATSTTKEKNDDVGNDVGRGSAARKKTAGSIRKLRKTVSDLKGKQSQTQDDKSESPKDSGGDNRSTREKIKDTGDHLEREGLTRGGSSSSGGGGGGGGGGPSRSPQRGAGRGPDTGSADASDQEKPSPESKEDAEHRRSEEKAEGKHRRGMEKKEHTRKQKGRAEWGKTIRKGLEGAGSLVKKGLEGAGKLAGGAARKVGQRYGMKTREKEAEGQHARKTEREAQKGAEHRKNKGAREGQTSAERMHADTQKTSRHRTSAAASMLKGGSKSGGEDKKAQLANYSPQENSPGLGIMSEHLKVNQSGENDLWQNLMTEVISNKKQSILDEAEKKKSNEKKGKLTSTKAKMPVYDTIQKALDQTTPGKIWTTDGADRTYVTSKGRGSQKPQVPTSGGRIAKGFTPGSSTPSSSWSSIKAHSVRTALKYHTASGKRLRQKYKDKK